MILRIVYPGDMKQMLSEQIYDRVRDAIMRGEVEPGQALKPQELAARYEVSVAVVREALVRLVGEGLAERLTNRGFAVPAFAAQRWQEILEARRTVEPAVLRLSVVRGRRRCFLRPCRPRVFISRAQRRLLIAVPASRSSSTMRGAP